METNKLKKNLRLKYKKENENRPESNVSKIEMLTIRKTNDV